MTCIVGLVSRDDSVGDPAKYRESDEPQPDRSTIWIGGDSAGVAGWDITIRKDPKVFFLGKEEEGNRMLIGCTTSYRMIQLLRFQLELPSYEEGMDVEEWMVTQFVEAVRERFKKGGFAKKKDDREEGGNFLVGFAGRLFTIAPDYQVGESSYGYDAVGSGENNALGSLATTTQSQSSLPPKTHLELALQAAERHNIGVRGPFHIMSLSSSLNRAKHTEAKKPDLDTINSEIPG